MVDLKKEIKLSDLRPKRKSGSAPKLPSAPPKRKAKRQEIVGLKIGSSQLAAAQVVNEPSGARLLAVARQPLDLGIVIGGEVRDITGLATALDAFFEENKLPRKGVRVGIGTNRIGVRVLDVEGITDERQLGNAVRFKAHESLSIPMDQAVLDYHVIDRTASDTGEITHRVVLAAAYREPIDHLAAACQSANIHLMGIDVEAFALLRAVGAVHSPTNGDTRSAVVALGVGHDRTTLAISDGSTCDFTRVMDWGGARLDAALGRELGVTREEAATLKESLSLLDDAPEDPEGDDQRTRRAREAVKRELVTLGRELIASLQFYQSQPGSLALGEILVTGGTTRMTGFADEVERLVRARVRVADPLAGVRVGEPSLSTREDLASLAVAIGLGIESE